MAMYEISWIDQLILLALWVGLLYGLFGLALGYLALTDLTWRQEIAARLRAEMRKFKVQGSRFKAGKPQP